MDMASLMVVWKGKRPSVGECDEIRRVAKVGLCGTEMMELGMISEMTQPVQVHDSVLRQIKDIAVQGEDACHLERIDIGVWNTADILPGDIDS